MLWAAASGSHGFTGTSAHDLRETERRSPGHPRTTPTVDLLALPVTVCLLKWIPRSGQVRLRAAVRRDRLYFCN